MRTATAILADLKSQGFELRALDGGLAVRPPGRSLRFFSVTAAPS
jgi:hypothetical protein